MFFGEAFCSLNLGLNLGLPLSLFLLLLFSLGLYLEFPSFRSTALYFMINAGRAILFGC